MASFAQQCLEIHSCICAFVIISCFSFLSINLALLTDEGIHSSLILGIPVSCVPGSKVVSGIAMVIVITWI